MANKDDKEESSGSSASEEEEDIDEKEKQRRLKLLEDKAVDKAKATADSSFRPSPSVLNAQSAAALLEQVDGPSLSTYEGKESVYVGRAVPIGAGSKLDVPIQVTTPGSVVEYSVELKAYDISFAITAERDEGVTIVKVNFGFCVSEIIIILFLGDGYFSLWLNRSHFLSYCEIIRMQ